MFIKDGCAPIGEVLYCELEIRNYNDPCVVEVNEATIKANVHLFRGMFLIL